CHDREVTGGERVFMMPHVFPNPSLEPVSHDRVPDPSRDRETHAEPRGAAGLAQPEKQEMIRVNFTAALLDVNKFRALAQPLSLGKEAEPSGPYFLATVTARRLRPLARRRFSTCRP